MTMKNLRACCVFSFAITAAIGCTSDAPPDTEPGADAVEPEVAEATGELGSCAAPPPINVDRSLFVSPTSPTEQAQLRAKFTVSRIMNHILASSGAAQPANGTELFRRWWDTQNSSATAVYADNPHCDDSAGTVNGYPVECPRNEGSLATATPDSHFPVALIYRPDLAASDGSHCGEARIVIARPNDALGRNLPIFEAVLPNPRPGCGLAGCRVIAQFWAALSQIDSFSLRLAALERFYFQGVTVGDLVIRPALDAANLGLPNATGARRGQIRTNQFMTGPVPRIWQLREFQLARACTGTSCRLYFEPASVKNNPHGPLFNDNDPHVHGASFREGLLGQINRLVAQDVTGIGMSVAGPYNAGQSNAHGPASRYSDHFALGNPEGFRQAIAGRLTELGVTLTPDNLIARATAVTCGGCHQMSNNAVLGGTDAQGNPLVWPPSAGFVHVLETGARSPALNNVFLPKRKQILQQFLLDTCNGTCAGNGKGGGHGNGGAATAATVAGEVLPIAGIPMTH